MGKRAVVTGASSGIGQATAILLAAHGWDVIAVARRADRLAALEAGHGIHAVVGDVTDPDDVRRIADEVSALGPLHALVNNAGGAFGSATVEDGDPEDWRAMYEVNVLGTLRMIQALLPALRAGAREVPGDGPGDGSGDGPGDGPGHADILSITSVAGHEVYEKGAGYNAAKFAQHALMGVLRLELAGEPLRVIEIAPGMVRTEGFAITRFGGDRDAADAVYAGVEHPLVAEDIAEVVVHALELPGHVNLDLVTLRPVAQAAATKVIRRPLKPR
ncbi:MAG: SDR family oxidoreductase [Microbacteriaceae bacterium]|nr:SDR family oxidoreductase [Microbacteriaceae bacterium]